MRKNKVKKILEIVKNNYNKIASEFAVDRNKKLWPEVIKQVNKVEDNARVLDLGCGSGRLLEELNTETAYLGIDNSEELLKIAKENYKDRKNSKFIVQDAINLDKIKNKPFNYIFSIAMLHHIPSKKLRHESLISATKFLQKEGEFFITVWNMWAWKKFRWQIIKSYFNFFNSLDSRDLLFYWQGKNKSLRYYHAFSQRGFKKEIKKAGLKIISSQKGHGSLYILAKKV
jgi:ubiquinone/menaquinone biosynthesis C-methylase UbiE